MDNIFSREKGFSDKTKLEGKLDLFTIIQGPL